MENYHDPHSPFRGLPGRHGGRRGRQRPGRSGRVRDHCPADPPGPTAPVTGAITKHPPAVHTVVVGGMPGWQIALIAAGAAVLAAALAVVVDRLLSARRAGATRVGHRPARLGSDTAA
jgi:hypothetical protein